MVPTKLFGYGSLINRQSMRRTSPDAAGIRAAYVDGFRRSFNLWDDKGLTDKSHGPLKGQPHCALDIEPAGSGRVNGVVFEVTTSLADLKSREHMYRLIEVEAFDCNDNAPLGVVCVFSAGRNDGAYVIGSPAQDRYLAMCLAGAESWGRGFYDEFLATTYIGDRPLTEFPKLLGLGSTYVANLDRAAE